MKIKIVIPYFGRFPNYFEFFLKSCEANDEIKFLVFTDQTKVFFLSILQMFLFM